MFAVGFGDVSDLRELDAYSSVPTSDYEILIRSEDEIGEVPGLMVYNLKRSKSSLIFNAPKDNNSCTNCLLDDTTFPNEIYPCVF